MQWIETLEYLSDYKRENVKGTAGPHLLRDRLVRICAGTERRGLLDAIATASGMLSAHVAYGARGTLYVGWLFFRGSDVHEDRRTVDH